MQVMERAPAITRRRLVLGAATTLAVPQARAQPAYASAQFHTLDTGAGRRRFRLFAPHQSAGRPLVLAFHGVSDSPANMATYSRLDEAAAEHGWILAYPAAETSRWPYFSARRMAREVDFCGALISHLVTTLDADATRVHLTGMSGGAFFINVVASRLSQQVASIAAHSGGLGILGRDGINAQRKFPVLVIHGQDDQVTPIDSGRAMAAQYQREGHAVEVVEYPNWGHVWAHEHGVNQRIADFFQRTPLT